MCYFQFTEDIMFKEIEWFSRFLWVGKGGAGTKVSSGSILGVPWCLLGRCTPTFSTVRRQDLSASSAMSQCLRPRLGQHRPGSYTVGNSLMGRKVKPMSHRLCSSLHFPLWAISPLVRVSPGKLLVARDCRSGLSIHIARVLYLHVGCFMCFTASSVMKV